jgi:DNA modification methylase
LKTNKLNDLDAKDWLKFTKSWEIVNPAPRAANKMVHPASFPEELASRYIEFFTKRGGWVLEPFLGTGSTLISSMKLGRNAVGIEINPEFADIARNRLDGAEKLLDAFERVNLAGSPPTVQKVLCGDSRFTTELLREAVPGQQFDYCFTSPPYWDMLHQEGCERQQKRRDKGLSLVYSDNEEDLGNVHDYGKFLEQLLSLFNGLSSIMKPKSYMTVVLQNVRKGGKVYPLAWEFAIELARGGEFQLENEKLWLSDNKSLFPFALGSSFVANQHHQYCLNFRRV